MASTDKSSAQQKAARYALILSLAIVFGVGIYLSFIDDSQTLVSKLAGLGLNLVASGFFAVIFTNLSDRERQLAMTNEIDMAFERHSLSLLTEWRNQVTSYVPDSTFGSTEGFDPTFNRQVTEALSRSSSYTFRGVTAKYVPIRLSLLQSPPTTVTVILPDPRSDTAMQRRVADRSLNPKYSSRSPEVLLVDIFAELRQSLVGLYDQRFRCAIEIAFSIETFVTRTEMTDHCIFLSLYHESDSRAQHFPKSLRFEANSFYYHIERLECERRIALADKPARIDYRTTEQDICLLLTDLFGKPTKEDDLPPLREEFKQRMAEFSEFLKRV